MQFISSDTNVWIDFITIRQAELPFRLPYTYLMETSVIDDELLYGNITLVWKNYKSSTEKVFACRHVRLKRE